MAPYSRPIHKFVTIMGMIDTYFDKWNNGNGKQLFWFWFDILIVQGS